MMDLQEILKGVSRSFYLSLRFLPKRVRRSMMLAFLACKAADTIADTRLLPRPRRLEILERYRQIFAKATDPDLFALLKQEVSPQADNIFEQKLLLTLPVLWISLQQQPTTDQRLIRELVMELTQGMIFDLERFPGETSEGLTALTTEAELDQYTYYVAGCVGRFWTKILQEHYRFTERWTDSEPAEIGEQFGKGLQRVNILRDLSQDLQQGRCYLPTDRLTPLQLKPADLLDPQSLTALRPYLQDLLRQTRQQLNCGLLYVRYLPRYAMRLRWVVLVPMRLGYQTLDLLEQSDTWLNPQRVHKVKRRTVYRTMVASAVWNPWPSRLVNSTTG